MVPYYNQNNFNQFIGYPVMMVGPNFQTSNIIGEEANEIQAPAAYNGSVNESKPTETPVVKPAKVNYKSAAVKTN